MGFFTEQEIESILKKSCRDLSDLQIRCITQALLTEQAKWQEVDLTETLGAMLSVQCKDICSIGKAFDEGLQIRAFIRQNNQKKN